MKKDFLQAIVSKKILSVHIFIAITYFLAIIFAAQVQNTLLYSLFIMTEIFNLFQIVIYTQTLWNTEYQAQKNDLFCPPVDVFITVAGENTSIVAETILAAKEMDYPLFSIHILNDGYVTNKNNWLDIEELAKSLNVNCITRKKSGGAKAGNINHALGKTDKPYIAVFDADHVPHKDFLRKTIPYFFDQKVAFVQSPQFYKNYNSSFITRHAWEQQMLFFGPICKGKNRLQSATMCGTNMVISRQALKSIGGMSEESIGEDFITGLFLHKAGWKSVYVSEILAEGLAPDNLVSYFKQQVRWARGGLDAIFKFNLLGMQGLNITQKLQYLSSSSLYLSGLVVLINIFIPCVFLYTGIASFNFTNIWLSLLFLPHILLMIYILKLSTNFKFTLFSLALSISNFNIQIVALWGCLKREETVFEITPKKENIGSNPLRLIVPHIFLFLLVYLGIFIAFVRQGFCLAFVINSLWAIFSVAIFLPFIYSTLKKETGYKNALIKE